MQQGGRTQSSLWQTPASVFPASHVQPTHFLIANLELEFPVTRCKQMAEPVSNRKYFAVFDLPPRSVGPNSPASRHPSLVTDFLIDTPRLEFLATSTKQSPTSDSNRYKTRSLRPGRISRNAVLSFASRRCVRAGSFRESLCDSVPPWPTPRATLTLPEPHSNLPASCFVRGFAGEHS